MAAKHRAPRGITEEQRNRVLSRFLQDCEEHFVLLTVDRSVIDRAVELVQRHRLRAYDAVQLATALVAGEIVQSQSLPAIVFVAADRDLLTAAAAECFSVENPLNYTISIPNSESNSGDIVLISAWLEERNQKGF